MKASALLAVVLTAGVIAGAGYVSLPQGDSVASEGPEVPPQDDLPPEGWQDPPEIDVSWARSGADVVVTFTRVDEPKFLDCAWSSHVDDLGDGDDAYIAWGNFTDRDAWKESSRYSHCPDPDWFGVPPWPEPWNGEGLELTDADGDHRLSPGDYLTIYDIPSGDEVDLELGMLFWGSWYYAFHWSGPPGGNPTI